MDGNGFSLPNSFDQIRRNISLLVWFFYPIVSLFVASVGF